MKIKASLKVNKDGRLFCTVHRTYKVIMPPRADCKICWTLYNNLHKQQVIDDAVADILSRVGH